MTLQVFNFQYHCIIRKITGKEDIEVLGWNTPSLYGNDKKNQSVDDLKFAILKTKVVDVKALKEMTVYEIDLLCKFIEQFDGSFNQIFVLKTISQRE